MPFTPLHFGPGFALKSVSGKWFSVTVFCFSQVLIDLEPAWYMLAGDDTIHRFLHTYLGATLAGLAAAGAKPLCELALRIWNSRLSPAQAHWLGAPDRIAWTAALCGGLLGGWSHVLLDSLMHADMRPLAPWDERNALLFAVHLDTLYLGCALAGVFGVGLLLLRRARPGKAGERA
ncbi:MAG: hypothetical protein WAO95_10430 [Burkholderiales bacterium]